MGDFNKRYVIGVGADKKSLEQLKADLNNTIKDAFNKIGKDGQVHSLSRADKAAIKADLASVFDISSEQAEALRKMVQGIIPTDTKGIANMKAQLQDTLKFATGIMEQMKQLGASTDWMKQGVSFVDKFTGLQSTLENTRQVVDGIQSSIDALTKSFKPLQDALATTNPDAFAKRFGKGAKSGVQADANIKAIAKEMTDAAERASRKIQAVIEDLENDGIQIAVTLQDPDAEKFVAQINDFVKKASDQFAKNPIKLDVELLDPFKNGAGAKLTKHQQKLADEAKEVAKSSGFSDESLLGLDSPDTSRTIRHIIDSFVNIQKAVKEGQKGITDATKKWRQEINNELTLKAKFDNLDIKSEAAKLMHELQAFLNENPPLFIDVDIDSFVDSLQEALKETVLSVNVKADNIDGKGAVLNLDGTRLASGDKIEPVRNDPRSTRPPQSSAPVINATKENSEAVNESTRAQTVLSKSIDSLNSSIKRNEDLDEMMKNSETSVNSDTVSAVRNQINTILSSDLKKEDKNKKIDDIISNVPQIKAITSKIASITSRGVENTNRRREIDKLIASENDQSVIAALNTELQALNNEWSQLYDQIQKLEANKTKLTNLFLSDEPISAANNFANRRKSENKQNRKRINNIQSVLDSDQSPVQLVFDELQEFWKKSYRTIEKTKEELDNLKNGKYSDDLKAKLSKLSEDEQKAMVQGLISQKEKRITDWESRQSLMSQKGLGDWTKGAKLEDVLKSFTVESLTDVLGKSSTLSDDLLNNSSLKSLSSIKELAYYASIAQDALGFKVQTDKEYVDEATLQARLMELARIKAFADKVQGMFPRNNGTPELQGIEDFIQFFEKLVAAKADISTIVSHAQGKIDAIQNRLVEKSIERQMLGEPENPIEYENAQRDIARLQNIIDNPVNIVDAAKEYLESFKNFAKTIENDTKFAAGEDGKSLTTSQMAQVIWDGMDTTVRDSVTKAMLSSSEFAGVKELNQVSIAGVLDKMAKVFETGALKDITSEDKSYQQLVALLDRQSKFHRVKTISDLQYGGSVKGSLYDARTPDKPIYVKVVGSHGEESVYDVHKPQKGATDSDRSFSTNSKGLERFFKHLGITEQVDEIVSAMFNDPELAQNLTNQLFASKNISLSTKPFTKTASKDYSFANTPIGKAISDKNKLEKEIANLEDGNYSQLILKRIEGLSGDERTTKIQEIIANKKAELESLKQLEFSEEEINQSLIALMSDIEIGKAQERNAKRSAKRNANRATNLTDTDSPDWAYMNRQSAEQTAAKRAADMIRSGTKGSSQNLANPLQQIIDRVKIASQYGLMDTKEIEQLLADYDEAYKIARNMPRIKDAGTPVSMFDEINDAWKEEEKLRNQVFEAFFGSDGWYVTQVVTDQMSVIEGELARKEQSITSGASTANSAIESQIADINEKETKAKQDADAYAAKLYDKYLKEPEAEIQAELRRRSAEIEAKAQQTQTAKNNLESLADRDQGLKNLESEIFNKMQKDSQLIELNQLRRQATVGSPLHQRYTQEIKEIETKYSAEYNKARQAWIDAKTAELDAEYKAFVQSVKEGAVGDASKNSVAKFNKDFKGITTSKRKVSGIQKFIESEKKRLYQEAEAATQQAMAALDMSSTVSQESVNKDIEKARKDAAKRRKAVLKSVKKKSDAELMAEGSYGQAATTASAEVERLKEQNRNNEKLLKVLLAQYNRTKEMLNAERGIYESSQATQTAMQKQLGDDDSRMSGGGGYLGTIDTSHLATEATLRGIYALLNGGAPAGGWDENNKFVSGIKEELDLSVHSFSGKLNDFASGVVKATNDIGKLSYENMAIFGDGGRVGKYIKGKENEISSSQIKNFLSRHKDKNLQLALHNHPDGIAALTPQDIQSAINMKKLSGLGAVGSIAGSKITGIDISNVNETTSKKLLEKYKENIRSSVFAQLFDDDFNIKEEFANSPNLDKQKLSEKLNGLLQKAISDLGLSVDEIYGQIDVSQLDEASKKVANAVVEAGAQAAVESSKQITKEDIKKQQAALQEKFKTKDAETGKPKYSVTGASKIDQALYNVGDRLTKESLTDKDLGKLSKAYSQLENAFKEEIISHLDQETVDFLNTLRGQISSVLDANSSQIAAKGQQSKAIADAKKYLSELKTEEGKRVSGASRAKTGLDKVYGVLDKGKDKLSKKDLTSLSQGYEKLQKTVSHAVFEKLDENTKAVINNAIQQAETVLSKHGATTQSGSTTKEIAAAESQITQEKQKQNKLSTEAAQNEEKQATATKERASAEKQATKGKKVKVTTKTDSTTHTSSSDSNQGGFLGALNRIAQEETLRSIAAALAKGVKTTAGEKSGGSGGKKNDGLTVEDAESTARSYIANNYPHYTQLGDLKPTANGYSIDVFQPRLKEIAATQQLINKLEAEGKQNTDEYVQAKSRLKDLELEREKITLRINNVDGKVQVTEKKALQNLAVGTKAAAKELQLVDNMMSRLHESGAISVGDNGEISSQNATITNYLNSLAKLESYDGSSERVLSQLTLATQGYRREVELLLKAQEQYNAGEKIGVLSGDLGDNYSTIKNAMQSMVSETSKYKATFGELTPVIKNGQVVSYQLAYSMQIGKRAVQDMTASLDPLTGELRIQKGAVRDVATRWDKFLSGLSGKFKSISQYLFSMGSIHRVWSTLRQGVTYVREINSALTELRKVTNETDASYKQFLQDMSKTGAVIGSTVKDLTSSASDWARLGYSMQEAGELAKNTSILMNVSEFDDVSKATDTLISSLQAFKKEGTDVGTFSMEIIDKYNQIGNNYAISTSDLAESLTRSSAALVAANNSLEESIALTTAANTTMQDPEAVGNALKVVSMRIRGVKTELEEAGEDTENMVTNTAKLQEKIMALTDIDGKGGIDILTNTGEFKSTYDILLAISKVWKDMDDVSQASLLETVAGKTRGSVVAALFQNGDVLEKARESATGASGSAMNELNTYLDSIQGRIDLFNNSVQTMWMNLLDTNVIKGIVDLGTALMKFLDSAPGRFAALSAIVGIVGKFLKIGPAFTAVNNQFQILGKTTTAIKNDFTQLSAQSTGFFGKLKAGLDSVFVSSDMIGGSIDLSGILSEDAFTDRLNTAITGFRNMGVAIDEVQWNKYVDGVTQSDQAMGAALKTCQVQNGEIIVGSSAYQVYTGAATSAAAGNTMVGDTAKVTTGKLIGMKVAALAANAALTMGISLLISLASTAITSAINKADEAKKAAQEAIDTYKEAQKTLQEQKKTIDELSASYERLSKGVNLDTNKNIDLTTKSYQEYLDICNDIADMYPQLVTGFDAQGNAILSLKGNVDELVQTYREAAQAARDEIILSSSDIWKNFDDSMTAGLNTVGLLEKKEAIDLLFRSIELEDKNGVEFYTKNFNTVFHEIFGVNNASYEHVIDNLDKLHAAYRNTVNQMNTESRKVISLIDAYLNSDSSYTELGDRQKSIIRQFVSNLDAEFIHNFNSADDLWNHIKTNFVEAFNNKEIADAIQDITNIQAEFEAGKISVQDYEKIIEPLKTIMDKAGTRTRAMVEDALGIDLDSHYGAIKKAAELLGVNYYTAFENGIKDFSVEDLSIIKELEVPEGTIYSWDELIEKIKEAKIAATQDFDITDHTDAIASHSAVISEFQEALQKLGKGSFTMDDFMDLIGKYPKLAKGVDVSSNAFYGLSRNLNRAIKSNTKSFIKDLKNLKTSLLVAGKSTESIDQLIEAVENMPDDALDDTIERYQTLADEIDRARLAQDRLLSSMEENPNEGYENRGEAMDYMKEAMKRGEIGSESNLWNVAEQYGFTYDSAKTINENADALAEYIAIRETWFKQDDDGNYTYDGTENFIEAVEKVVDESEAAGTRLSEILDWNYNEKTGVFDFDFDNKDLPEIISLLSQTKELVGLTEQEWMDLMVQVGQYFGINWGDYQDAKDYLDGIANGTSDAKTKVEEYGKAMQDYFGKDTEIDLTSRTQVDAKTMQDAGWDVPDGSYATVNSVAYSNEDETVTVTVTPILPDGKVLTEEQLNKYANDIVNGADPAKYEFVVEGKTYTGDDIVLAKHEGSDSIDKAKEYGDALHQVQEQYDKLRDTLNIETTINESGLAGLEKIPELQDAIDKNSEGAVLIDEEAFREALTKAEYTEDQIDRLIAKIKEVNGESFNIDNFKIDEALEKNGIEALKQVQELQGAIKEDANTGLTIFDTDMFTSVLTGAGYTENKITELIKKIQEYNNVVSVEGNTDPLGLNTASASIDTLRASLNTLGIEFDESLGTWMDGKTDVTINVTDLVTTLKEKGWTDEAIKNYCAQLSETNLEGFNIKVNQEEVDAAIAKANEIPEQETTQYEVTGTGAATVKGINDEWAKVPTTKSTNYTITETTVKKTEDKTKFNIFDPSTWVDGTAHAQGTAFAGGSWGAPDTETSLVGELGPEILVRNGRWTTVGENGAEFTQVKKGDIIFNHKQTESLLKNGYVTGRGKAYASGTAFVDGGGAAARYKFSGSGGYTKYDVNDKVVDSFGDFSDAASDAADAADEFKETIDWIEVRLEELDEDLGMLNAQLENAVYYTEKNNKIDDIIAKNREKMANLEDGADYYESYISKFWNKIPAQYQEAAKNGAIAITDFAGEASEEVVEAIQSYRDYVQKAADLRQQKEELKTEIRDLAIQRFDNAYEHGNVRATVEDSQTGKLQNTVDYDETRGLITSDAYYVAMMENSNKKIEYLTNAREAMQEELDRAVKAGEVVRGSNEWYELLNQMYQVDAQIDEATIELEEFQNAINDIYWDNFDQLINRLDYLKDETQSLIDLMDSEDMVITPETDDGWTADQVEWTKEGLASLGLYAQQMEIAEYKSKQYAEAIDDLTKEYEAGHYSENEYIEKLEELKSAQYDSIEAYYDAQDAIKELQEARVDEIKKGIEKQVKAYEKLIDKQKEALDSEKDLYDFQKSTMESQKNISEIERQLAALANDHSLSATAKRKQLEAELAEAQYELQDMYYNRSVEDKQTALDKELEDFQAEKDAEIEKWDEYLTNVELLVTESLGIVQTNASEIGQTLTAKAEEYNLTVSDAILTPWKDGSIAVSDYQTTFDTAMSSTTEQLEKLKNKWQEVIDKMAEVGKVNVDVINKENEKYAEATKQEPVVSKPATSTSTTTKKEEQKETTYTVKKGDTLSGIAKKKLGKASRWKEIYNLNKNIIKNPNLIYPGQKFKLPKYAKGTTGVKDNQLALIDELGDELVFHASNGKLAFLSKGSAVMPHDITENLMKLGSLDPTDVLSRNTPQIGVHPEIHNTEIKIDMHIAEVVHIDEVTQDTIPDLTKAVRKEMDSYMLKVNNAIKSKVR